MIKAPFNFVPLSDKVFFPDWADQISHDIPFEDGVSGTIELKITAESPIFVRNGHTKTDADAKNETYSSFSKTPNGKYFIPATSIKGAIRNVLEIMSFGKMRLDKSAMFAQREWDNPELYTIKNIRTQQSMRCGYLKATSDGFVIEDHGKPYRIGHERIDEYLEDKVFERHFSRKSSFDINNEVIEDGESYDPKTAAYKYHLIENLPGIENLVFSLDSELCDANRRNRVMVDDSGDIKGTIILTGQPDKWESRINGFGHLPRSAGKYFEFVFQNEKDIQRGVDYKLTQEEFNHFKFIYSGSKDWDRAKTLLDSKGIPVFFRIENRRIKDFGLAFLYKLPYDKSPYDTLPKQHQEESKDLTDCIFGYVNGKDALKGRVQFTSAMSDDARQIEEVRLSLGSPKASYYPIYVRQNNARNGSVSSYSTYNDSTIAGWKRYQIRNGVWNQNTGSDKIDTLLLPLGEGATFTGKVNFFNLKEIELGALLSALTFHNTEDCYHQIGQGKSFGYGKVKIEATLKCDSDKAPTLFMALFEKCMNDNHKTWIGVKDWTKTSNIEHIFTLAHTEVSAEDVLYEYMNMSNNTDDNEFLSAKKHNEYLREFTAISLKRYTPRSMFELHKNEIDAAEILEQQKKEAEEKQRQEELIRLQQEKEAQEKAEREAKQLHQMASGLAVLNEKNELGNYKWSKWDQKRLQQVIKKLGWDKIPNDQAPYLVEYLNRLDFKKDRDKQDVKKFLYDKTSCAEEIIKKTNL